MLDSIIIILNTLTESTKLPVVAFPEYATSSRSAHLSTVRQAVAATVAYPYNCSTCSGYRAQADTFAGGLR